MNVDTQFARRQIRTASITTLGCKLNQAESYRVQTELARAGVKLVPFGEAADLAIVNTCTVTQAADHQARQLLRRASLVQPGAIVVAMGCYAQVAPGEVASVEGVSLVVASDKEQLIPQLQALGFELGPEELDEEDRASRERSLPETRVRHFVKVQDGCDDYCTYCIVPFARGPARSRPADAIVDEVNVLVERGVREVVLTGVQIGAYGRDRSSVTAAELPPPGAPLARLVRRLLEETSVPRIRISSIQPQDWSDEFLALFSDSRLCHHLHLPLQAGCDATLRRMSRRYSTEQFRRLVDRVRGAVPDLALTADLIVGFPGESEADHAASLEFVREMAFADAHVFRFSPRKGTAASRMSGQVPPEVKQVRGEEMRAVSLASATEYRSRFLNQSRRVLWESMAEKHPWCTNATMLTGVTDNYLRVDLPAEQGEVGTFNTVRLARLVGDRFLAAPLTSDTVG